MRLIYDDGHKSQIWAVREDYGKGPVWEYFVYGVYETGDPRVCPSLSMACDVAGISPLIIQHP